MAKINDHYLQGDTLTDEKLKEYVSLSLSNYRKDQRLTFEELAKKVGVSRMQIMRWEKLISKPGTLALEKLVNLEIIPRDVLRVVKSKEE
jgi:transcriptional regulator with XRE-family HTH domain